MLMAVKKTRNSGCSSICSSPVCRNARALAASLKERGHSLVTGGTETHLLVVDLSSMGITGKEGERRLQDVGILANKQLIQTRLADMARRITAAQLLSLRLGRLKDAGKMHPTQVSLAKWNNVRMALDIARDCRDMLGGAGISAEYVPVRHALNLESVITYEGTESIQQLVVGKELTGVSAF